MAVALDSTRVCLQLRAHVVCQDTMVTGPYSF